MTTDTLSDLEEMKGPPKNSFGGPSFGQSAPNSVNGFGGSPIGNIPRNPGNIGSMGKGFGGIPGQSPGGVPSSTINKPPMGGGSFGMGINKPPMQQGGFGNAPSFSGSPMQQTPQQPQEKVFVPINTATQSSRENAVKRFTSTVFSSFELIPLLVGTVNPVPFTRTLTLLSGILCALNIIYGTVLRFETLLSPVQTILLVAINSMWYIYSKNRESVEDEDLKDAADSLPDLPEITNLASNLESNTLSKSDITLTKTVESFDKNLTQTPPMGTVSPNFSMNTSLNKPKPNLTKTTPVESYKSPVTSQPVPAILDDFKAFSGDMLSGFNSFGYDTVETDEKSEDAEEWEIVSDTTSEDNQSNKQFVKPVLTDDLPSPFSAVTEKAMESAKPVSNPTLNLFEDPEDLEINLDDFIPKTVDTSGAKSMSLDSVIENANLVENMKSIESMGTEISNLIELLGEI